MRSTLSTVATAVLTTPGTSKNSIPAWAILAFSIRLTVWSSTSTTDRAEAEHRVHSPRRDAPAYALADINSPTPPATSGTQRHAPHNESQSLKPGGVCT